MENAEIGWIAAIFVGGIAGWLAEKVTGSNMGIITNIILGMIGAGVAAWLFGLLGIAVGGSAWVSYLISGFVGACVLILLTRLVAPGRWRT
ncbi:MAG TPA: GlsB/YeaQ/YmgE family stress response membrane protein [Xanthobacteraceae bacterium]|nr:GlsB/YeaQ/YmgE family stress response membrane protein [Xanthobacteraceae bacterium]